MIEKMVARKSSLDFFELIEMIPTYLMSLRLEIQWFSTILFHNSKENWGRLGVVIGKTRVCKKTLKEKT